LLFGAVYIFIFLFQTPLHTPDLVNALWVQCCTPPVHVNYSNPWVFNLRAKGGQYSKKGDPTFKCTPCILRNHLSSQNMRRKHDAEEPTSLCINNSPCAFHEITPPMASPVPGSAAAAKVSITFISGPTIHLLARLPISRASFIFYSSLNNSASIPAASRIGPLTPINPASYHDCLNVFRNREGTILPPCRTCVHDHKFEIEDGATPPSGPAHLLPLRGRAAGPAFASCWTTTLQTTSFALCSRRMARLFLFFSSRRTPRSASRSITGVLIGLLGKRKIRL